MVTGVAVTTTLNIPTRIAAEMSIGMMMGPATIPITITVTTTTAIITTLVAPSRDQGRVRTGAIPPTRNVRITTVSGNPVWGINTGGILL